ncbi:MAG: PadR family transcriptional regulator [Pseudomonadota bacterium]
MNVRTLCLAMLSMGDASGYEIKKQSVEGDWSHFVEASFGAIYPALRALEEGGYVTSRQEGDPGRPPRKVYAITEAGREALMAAFTELPAPDVFRSEFLMHTLFAEDLSRAHLREIIDRRIAEYEDKKAHIERMMERFIRPGPQWAGRLGLAMMTEELNYLRTHRAALEEIGHDEALPLQVAAE